MLESGLSPPPPPPGPSPPTHTQGEGGGDLLRSQNLDQGFPRIKFRGVLPEQGPRGAHWKLGFGGVGWMGGGISLCKSGEEVLRRQNMDQWLPTVLSIHRSQGPKSTVQTILSLPESGRLRFPLNSWPAVGWSRGGLLLL